MSECQSAVWLAFWISCALSFALGMFTVAIFGGGCMDDADMSDIKIENLIRDGINEVRLNAAKNALQPCGVCHWCQEPAKGNVLFCDAECAADWQHERDRRKANGDIV